MPCARPMVRFRVVGSDKFVAHPRLGDAVVERQEWRCGRCFSCVRSHGDDWSTRLEKEQMLWPRNCVVTLTYDQEHLPLGGNLVKHDLSGFVMRLRNYARRECDQAEGVRFYGIGEFGSRTRRPHYHVILFNFDFPDLVHWSGKGARELCTSEALTRIWGKGVNCKVGRVGADSISYVSRYLDDKRKGGAAAEFRSDAAALAAGEELPRFQLEFSLMSRNPGIGAGWLERFESDVYPGDHVVLRSGREARPPRFFDKRYERELREVGRLEEFEALKACRRADALERSADNTPARLAVKDEVLRLRQARYARDGV